jgi:hypothetical protein
MKHIAIMVSIPEPPSNYRSVEEMVEQTQIQLPRGAAVEQVIELTDVLHSVLTRTRSANLVKSLAAAVNKGVHTLRAVR